MKLVQFWKNNAPALGIQTEKGIVDAAAEADKPDYVFDSLDNVDQIMFGK